MIKYADLDISSYKDQAGYALRAVIEFRYVSKDCEKTKSFVKKAIDAGGSVDTFTIAGSIYQRCGDIKSAISSYKNAFRLAPNDNGLFITKNLIVGLYQNNDLDSIERIIVPKLNIKDFDPVILGFFSYVLLKKGKVEDAQKFF